MSTDFLQDDSLVNNATLESLESTATMQVNRLSVLALQIQHIIRSTLMDECPRRHRPGTMLSVAPISESSVERRLSLFGRPMGALLHKVSQDSLLLNRELITG